MVTSDRMEVALSTYREALNAGADKYSALREAFAVLTDEPTDAWKTKIGDVW